MPTKKIYIAAHQNFKNCPTSKDYEIICGPKMLNKDQYNIDIQLEDSPQHYVDLHDSYAELTRIHHIYTNIKPLPSIVGFCQYRKYFNFLDNTDVIDDIMKEHDAILPMSTSQRPNAITAYGNCHRKRDIEECIEIAKMHFPHFSKSIDEAMNRNYIHAHNMFIMKSSDFKDYCFFLFRIFETFDVRHGFKTMEDMQKYGIVQKKTHGFLAERLSNIFYVERFKNPKCLPVTIIK